MIRFLVVNEQVTKEQEDYSWEEQIVGYAETEEEAKKIAFNYAEQSFNTPSHLILYDVHKQLIRTYQVEKEVKVKLIGF